MRDTPSRITVPGSSPGSRRTTFSLGEGGFSLTTRRPLMSVAIDALLEWFDADAMHDVDEALGFAVATFQIHTDKFFNHLRNIRARERRPEHLAERGRRLISADLDLVPLLAVLIDAEDADVADVMVAARVHAAGDIQIQLADLVQVVEIVEALLDRLRDRDRLRVRQRAEVS